MPALSEHTPIYTILLLYNLQKWKLDTNVASFLTTRDNWGRQLTRKNYCDDCSVKIFQIETTLKLKTKTLLSLMCVNMSSMLLM